jgi:hypothetical protein
MQQKKLHIFLFYNFIRFIFVPNLKLYNMKFELKNIKFYESMSEETNCFQADLFINGKKIAYVKNTGQGGPTDYGVHDFKLQSVLREAEQFCLSLPKEKIEGMMSDFEFQPTLESRIDDLFEAWLKVKADKKFEKQMEKGILYGKNKMYSYHIVCWNVPIKAMLMTDKGREVLRKKILDIKQGGDEVFNTNIPQELFN